MGKYPTRGHHMHIDLTAAQAEIKKPEGIARWRWLIDGWVVAPVIAVIWRGVGISGELGGPVGKSMQLVEGVVGGRAGQFKVRAGAHGARDRKTSVRATNER
jgi:hypothetical protein